MGDDDRESCGRCGMSTVVAATGDGREDPYGDERIEVDEDELRSVSGHVVALGRLKDRLDDLATRLTYGK
ncbi:hypothetical protein [Haloarchaeobius sp. DFWS5]|uniref:hypothetical protein n=1 Tax=Haloarchaeobius sp. DFWS5 TaxID=3446114 RepID=UPI003EBA7399